MKLRTHQAEFETICKQIASRQSEIPDWIFAHVIPGGGKSTLPVIAAYWLIQKAKLADKICWIVPNGSLQRQASEAFLPHKNARMARHLGLTMQVVETVNEENPSKGTGGYVATYHAVRNDKHGVHVRDFERHRYILFADELHHCTTKNASMQAIKPLVERAVLTVGMTGTIDRADNLPVYGLPYGIDRKVATDNTPGVRWVQYGIKAATHDQSIIKVHFNRIDAAAKWYDRQGQAQEAKELGDNRDALFTALRTEYAKELMDACLDSWQTLRLSRPRSKLLVVCADTAQAKMILDHLKARRVASVEIATYREDFAEDSIDRFRNDESPAILVTVAKAYEGLDVQSVTHIACLTHIRSRPWIMQMLGRGWRTDPSAGPWQSQVCHAFVPDDEAMQKCILDIASEQEAAARDLEERIRSLEETAPNDLGTSDQTVTDITPLTSASTCRQAGELGGEELTPEESTFFGELAKEHQLPLSPIQLKNLIADANAKMSGGIPQSGDQKEAPEPTATQRIEALRSRLNEMVAAACRGNPEYIRTVNADLKRLFGSMEARTEQQLLSAQAHLRRQFPGKFGRL